MNRNILKASVELYVAAGFTHQKPKENSSNVHHYYFIFVRVCMACECIDWQTMQQLKNCVKNNSCTFNHKWKLLVHRNETIVFLIVLCRIFLFSSFFLLIFPLQSVIENGLGRKKGDISRDTVKSLNWTNDEDGTCRDQSYEQKWSRR